VLMLLLCGCSVHTSMNVKNNTGKTIEVFSHHTGKLTTIKPNESKNIEHTMGAVSITLEDGVEWDYTNISIPDMQDAEYKKVGFKNLFSSKVTVYLMLDSDGRIFIQTVNPNRESINIKSQPKGFPLIPK